MTRMRTLGPPAALAALALLLAGAPTTARADNDFRNGFEDELGRLAAREVGRFVHHVVAAHRYALVHGASYRPAPPPPPPPVYYPAAVPYQPPPPPPPPPPRDRGYSGIPPGHLPPPGLCRIWYPDRPPGHQPPPGDCDRLMRRYREGYFIYGG